MSSSEVAKIQKDIDLQLEAAKRALIAPAVVASHQFITARMERMVLHLKALEEAGLHKEAKEFCTSAHAWK